MKPVRIGLFADAETAEQVLVALDLAEGANEVVVQNTEDRGEQQAEAKAEVPSPKPVLDPGVWTEEDLPPAFVRLERGEELGAVARDFDRSWHLLRKHWAARRAAQPAAPAPEPWTEAEKAAAFDRLEAGETIKAVVASFGKSWHVLRGHWARRQHLIRAAKEAEEVEDDGAPDSAPAADDDGDDDMEECRLCGRAFRPTPARMELCARCARD